MAHATVGVHITWLCTCEIIAVNLFYLYSCSVICCLSLGFCPKIVIMLDFLKGDVYPVEPYDSFVMNQVLDAHWGVLDDEDVSIQSVSLQF